MLSSWRMRGQRPFYFNRPVNEAAAGSIVSDASRTDRCSVSSTPYNYTLRLNGPPDLGYACAPRFHTDKSLRRRTKASGSTLFNPRSSESVQRRLATCRADESKEYTDGYDDGESRGNYRSRPRKTCWEFDRVVSLQALWFDCIVEKEMLKIVATFKVQDILESVVFPSLEISFCFVCSMRFYLFFFLWYCSLILMFVVFF